jgi:hypothetical protein
MATILDGASITIQGGANLPVGPLQVGFRFRSDGAVAGELSHTVIPASARGAYNAVTGEWSLALGAAGSLGNYGAFAGKQGFLLDSGLIIPGHFFNLQEQLIFHLVIQQQLLFSLGCELTVNGN